MLNIKPKSDCKWDAVRLGEVTLRLDPGEGRIRTTRSFQVWEGGGEYNGFHTALSHIRSCSATCEGEMSTDKHPSTAS